MERKSVLEKKLFSTNRILKQLVEVFDIDLWIKLRQMELAMELKKIRQIPPQSRETFKIKIKARLTELNHIRGILNQRNFNEDSKRMWVTTQAWKVNLK